MNLQNSNKDNSIKMEFINVSSPIKGPQNFRHPLGIPSLSLFMSNFY